MEEFITLIRESYFPHVNVEIYADMDRLVIEIKKLEILAYYPEKSILNINDPLTIKSGLEIRDLFDKKVGVTI